MTTQDYTTFGWCDQGPISGRPDAYCRFCPQEYTTQFGVLHVCACPNHFKHNPPKRKVAA